MSNTHEKEVAALTDAVMKSGYASDIGAIVYGGSIAYGLNQDDSDVDLRGFYMPCASDLLLLKDKETLEVKDGVDGAMHSVAKLLELLRSSNPNVIELLGLKPEHVLVSSDTYELILANTDVFISARAANTFGGYAIQQLRRIENSLSRDVSDKDNKGAVRSMRSALASFETKYRTYNDGDITIDVKDKSAGASGIVLNVHVDDVGLKELMDMCGCLNDIAKNADNLAARNRKKDTSKLAKHMSHLIRLLRMGSEMLETGAVNTYRTYDAPLLKDIKYGEWITEDADGTRKVKDEFWELLDEENKRFEYAEANTPLPSRPNDEAIDELIREAHAQIIRKEHC